MGDDESKVRAQLATLAEQDKLVGADHICHGMTCEAISALRGIPLRTVKRCIARVYAAIDRAGARRPAPVRASARHVLSGFTPALAFAL